MLLNKLKKSNPNQKKEEQAKKTIQQLIPIKEIEQGLLITPDLKMVQCLKVSAVNLELTSNAEANELFELFEGVLMSLNFPVQITNVSMPVDLKSYISNQESIRSKTDNPFKKRLQESYIDYLKEIETNQEIMQRQRYIIFSEQMKEDTPEVRYEMSLDLFEKREEIISALSEMNLTAEPVNDIEIIRYIHTLFDYSGAQNRPIESTDIPQIIEGENKNVEPKIKLGKKKEIESPQAMTIRDMIAPAPVFQEEINHMKLGDNYARTFLVIDFPSKPKGNFLSKLYRFKGNLTISTHLVPKPSDEYIKQTERSIMELNTELKGNKVFRMKPSLKLELENKLKAAEDTLENLMSGENKSIFHVHMYLHLQASSLDELERATKRLRAITIKRGLRIAPADTNMFQAFKAILPTTDNTIPEMTYRNFDTEAASSLMPFDESELFHPNGIVRGYNITTDSLVKVDQKALPSHNEFVVGFTGMGKSFYLIKDFLRKWMNGDRVFVIDPEGEISKVCQKVGGQVIKMSPMAKTVINILEIKPLMDSANIDSDDDLDEVELLPLLFQKIQRLKIFFKLIKKDMSTVEMAQLEKAIIATYEKKDINFDTDFTTLESTDFPILEDLYNELGIVEDHGDLIGGREKYAHLQDFREILFMYVHGSNSRMFNGHTKVNLDNDFICFNLKELEDESDSQAAAMYNALSFLWDEITSKNDKFTWLNVDEAHTIADPDNPRAMKFLYQIYKRIRKYGGGATVATQQIADYLSAVEGKRNYGQAIIGNSISQLILPLKDTDIEDLKKNKILKLSEEEELKISKLRQGEGIYVVGNNRVHMKVDHTPEEMRLINPDHYEKLYGQKDRVANVR